MKFLNGGCISKWLGVFFLLSLLGCGNKGDLYLPEDGEQVKSQESQSEQVVEINNQDLQRHDN